MARLLQSGAVLARRCPMILPPRQNVAMPIRAARLLAVLVLAAAGVVSAAETARVSAADPTASAVASPVVSPDSRPGATPTPTLPPTVGAPGTVTPGTTIRGAIGVLIGAIIVIIGWRRR